MQRVQKFTSRSAVQSDSNSFAPDVVLLTAVLLILSVGILFVYSTSSITADRNFGSAHFYLLKQGVFAFIGLSVMFACAYIDYHKWLKLTPFIYAGALIGLLIVLSGLGHSAGGSSRWIRLGGLSVQPSEFAKLALIFYLAHSLANRRDKVENFKQGFVPSLVISGLLLGLTLLQPDFGTTMVMASIMVILLFVAGTKMSHLIGAALLSAPAIALIMFGAEYRRKRIFAYLDPWSDPNGIGYQIIQSYIAFGSGALSGRGLGDGRQKLFFLPEAHTDFIFAVIGEESGFVGVLFLIMLYGIVVWRGMSIAINAKDEYGTFLATGITAMFGIQSFVNMSVVTGLLPTKGLTLPLISYGGSALVMNLMALGLLQSVHIHSRRDA